MVRRRGLLNYKRKTIFFFKNLTSRYKFFDSQWKPFDVSDFDNSQLLKIPTRECEQLMSTNIVRGKRLCVLTQLQRLQPTGHFCYTPTGDFFSGKFGAWQNTAAAPKALPKGSAAFASERAFAILQKKIKKNGW